MKKDNIEMTHREHRSLQKALFGVKKFKNDGVRCPNIRFCIIKEKDKKFCGTGKFINCYEYQVYRLLSRNQGHLNNDKFNKSGKCIINVNKGHTLQIEKNDTEV